MQIVKASYDNCKLYYNWVNDPVVRKYSIDQKKIIWFDHKRWFCKKLESKNTHMWLFKKDDLFVGQFRVDVYQKKGVIDFSVDSSFRGKGYGADVLKLGIEKFRQENPKILLEGVVSVSNIPSAKIFSRLGFVLTNKISSKNSDFLILQLRPLFSS